MSRKVSHSLRQGVFCLAILLVSTPFYSQVPAGLGSPHSVPDSTHNLSTFRPPDPTLGVAARLLVLTGRVSVLRDDVPWALSVGEIVKPQQVVLTGPDSYAEFQVADGSHFEVFPNSRVVFRNNSGDWRDLLDVLIGKVKVQIERLGGIPNPNRVRTPTAVISVRGTVFDVHVEDDDATTLILVEEGQVEVRHLIRGGEGKLLNPGEWLRVYKNQPIALKMVDRGALMQRAMRAGWDALYQAVLNGSGKSSTPSVGTPAGSGSGSGVGDHCPSGNPSCKAPPPPPPPPHP